ncbi:hypothetical protein CAPTEDRAFT_227953 [Capitella teleta]|uniref:NAD-dependent protein deacetylase n=1 Tax=Capitella teleta TaxID=283909 RepID=R7TK56_CAPTE|nr:hypothetical protein CAPTEDRAFT_227953 [Capitella teleta]|eukprot:ELT94099.1 hypothetical protein CAPTEDRAFT_227953 [Capitella teleta]
MGNLFQSAPKVEQLLSEVNYDGIIKYIQDGKCTNIITMAGAGISTSAGIPDFRTPGTGLYDNLAKYDLPNPQAIFEIHFFRKNPAPFYALAKELYPGVFKPTPCHYFLRLLHEKKLLLRHYTQNIDTLERVAGIPEEMIVEAHGTFATAHCIDCRKQFSQEWVKDKVFADEIPKCTDKKCGGLVKPDIVFFGENLPFRFLSCSMKDFPKCDLLIILGTSLAVQPFASLIDRVPDTTPRLYINLEKSESDASNLLSKLMGGGGGFDFESDSKYRDVFWQGTCDDGCVSLSERLGWKAELDKLTLEEHAKIDKEIGQ